MTPLVRNYTTWRCCRRSRSGDGSTAGLRTNGRGRRLGGRIGRRTAALKARGKRRYQALLWSFVAVTDPTWCGHVWPGGGGQR